MNPRLLLLVIAALAMLNSCTKDTINPTTQEPLSGSVIDIIYEEEASASQHSGNRLLYVPAPPSVNQDCRSTVPSVIVPKMYNQTLAFVYAKNSHFTGRDAGDIKSIKWTVNGKTQLTTVTTLEIPYRVNDVFSIQLKVIYKDGTTHEADFSFEASPDLQTLADGTILYDTGIGSFSGATVGQSCNAHQFGRAVSIVIIDIDI